MIIEIPDDNLNALQVQTIYRLIEHTRGGAAFINVVSRVDGRENTWEADWIKHMRIIEGPSPVPDKIKDGYAVGYRDGYAFARTL